MNYKHDYAYDHVDMSLLYVTLLTAFTSLTPQSNEVLAQMGECPIDPGGYFVVKGNEKVRTHTHKC